MQFPTPGVVRTIVENEHIHIIQYASHTKFLNHPGSGANLLPEYDTTFVNTVFSKWKSPTSEGLRFSCKSASELCH